MSHHKPQPGPARNLFRRRAECGAAGVAVLIIGLETYTFRAVCDQDRSRPAAFQLTTNGEARRGEHSAENDNEMSGDNHFQPSKTNQPANDDRLSIATNTNNNNGTAIIYLMKAASQIRMYQNTPFK